MLVEKSRLVKKCRKDCVKVKKKKKKVVGTGSDSMVVIQEG